MAEAAYPAHREAIIALRDGSTLMVRPVRGSDREALTEFLAGLSPEARALRFFSAAADVERVSADLVDVDYVDRYGIVATAGHDRKIVAHASYARTNGDRAEVAFAIADRLRGKGIATILLAHLAEAAEEQGIRTLCASVLPQNTEMLAVFRDSGLPVEFETRGGMIDVTLPAALGDAARKRFADRGRAAAVAAVRHVLEPRSVAVIGASDDPDKVGGRALHNLVVGGFEGPVYPVNPHRERVQSRPAFPSVGAIGEPVELAVIAVPGEGAVAAARECAAAGVRALVVLSAGFAEAGEEGRAREAELVEVCRESGMRLVGPNCLGVANTAPEVSLNASFGPRPPVRGNVGMMTQSGALGLALIEAAQTRGIGVSSFVSVGNKADISGNDLLAYWEQDPATEVIALYLESFGNPRKFARVARRVARRKPIVAMKSGRTETGARAAGSHTGAMVAASDVTVEALFRQAGVIRVDGLAELLDTCALLAKQPLPDGPRVGIVTNAGGPGIMCADACEALELEIPTLAPPLRDELAAALPPEASVANPVDMIATATPEDFRRTIATLAGAGAVDAVIAIFIEPLLIRTGDVAAAIDEVAAELEIPLLAVLMSGDPGGAPAARRAPVYRYPEDAARALAHAVRYAAWRRRPEPQPPRVEADQVAAATAISRTLAAGGGWMAPDDLADLLEAYSIPVARARIAADPQGAAEAAAELGGAVALKAVAPGLVHKTEAGAVRLGLAGAEAVAAAAREIEAAVRAAGHRLEGFLVQEMAEPGPELIVGITHDPTFGPLIACGAGGVEAELIRDVAVRLGPLDRDQAAEMLAELATYPRLTGYRGSPPVDLEAVIELLVRVAVLAERHPEVRELDLNPVIASPAGVLAVDARARLEPAPPRRPWPVA